MLMARLGMDIPASLIEEQVATALDLIVMSRRMPDGSRVISSLSEVSRTKTGQVELTQLVSFDPARREWQLQREPICITQALHDGVLSLEEVATWRHSYS